MDHPISTIMQQAVDEPALDLVLALLQEAHAALNEEPDYRVGDLVVMKAPFGVYITPTQKLPALVVSMGDWATADKATMNHGHDGLRENVVIATVGYDKAVHFHSVDGRLIRKYAPQ